MADAADFKGNVKIAGDLTVTGEVYPARDRSDLKQEDNAVYAIPLTEWKTWDAMATNLPGTPANDDLGLNTGTISTDSLTIRTGDLKAAGSTTRYAAVNFALPPEYVTGQSVTLRAHCGFLTTAADTAGTIDFQVYRVARDGTVGSDICATSATSCNSTTLADKDFTVTATTLGPGDVLHVRMAFLVNDGATATVVQGVVAATEFLLDIKG